MLKALLSIRSTTRIAITLGCICASVLWCAFGLKIFPDVESKLAEQRIDLCESIAISYATLINANQTLQVEPLLSSIKQRNEQIQSIAIRERDGKLRLQIGDHQRYWSLLGDGKSTADQMHIALQANSEHEGSLEISFVPLSVVSGKGKFFPLSAVLFCAAASTCCFWFYLSRILKHLNPSKVVPPRVKNALDSLAEGLLLINERQEIVLANQAIEKLLDIEPGSLQGLNPDNLAWKKMGSALYPWTQCLQGKSARKGDMLTIQIKGEDKKFLVNSTPVENESGKVSGVLISFDDITPFEDKKQELNKMLNLLRTSRDEVQRQNRELQVLASLDPLTGCMNRRSFFEHIKQLWGSQVGESLGVVMVDIDKFKSINDRFGHMVGDEVIKVVAKRLADQVGEAGLLCRYGGEEFCILLASKTATETCEISEQLRVSIEEQPICDISVTCSIGISMRQFGAMDIQHLMDQADQCLYVAKRSGRNQVARWDECTPEQFAAIEHESQPFMHYSAVTAMLSALAFRDQATAEHSQRVANLTVALAQNFVPVTHLNDLEISALLHDIGKIGVPDSVLFKPSELDDLEKQLLKSHERMSVQIIRSALANDQISEILSLRCLSYVDAMQQVAEGKTSEESVCMAQIVSVCDAFDSLTHSQPYRAAKSQIDAIDDLLESTAVDFSPVVVAQLIRVLHENPDVVKTQRLICDDPRTAYMISGKVEQLNQAIAERNFDEIRNIVQEIEKHALADRVEPLVSAAQNLNRSLQQSEASVGALLEMTSEVIELCRATRSTIVEPPFIEGGFSARSSEELSNH